MNDYELRTEARSSSDPEFDTDTIHAHVLNNGKLDVYVYVSRDGVLTVQIDQDDYDGRIRIALNDGYVWDGDPDTDAIPGANLHEVRRRGVDMLLVDDGTAPAARTVAGIAERVGA